MAVASVSKISACRLTIARWICSPTSPNNAAAIGMPTCTVLPKAAEIARTAGAVGGSKPLRSMRLTASYTPICISSIGTNTAISVSHGMGSMSIRAVVRNSSAGTKTQ